MELLDSRDYVKIRRSLPGTFTPLCPLGLSCVVQELPFITLRSRAQIVHMYACNQKFGKTVEHVSRSRPKDEKFEKVVKNCQKIAPLQS